MRRVIWSRDARDDYLAILRYIASEDPEAAELVVDAIASAGDNLADFATGHPGRVSGTYEKSVSGLPYIIAYSLTDGGKAVSILRVIHSSRDWGEDQWPE